MQLLYELLYSKLFINYSKLIYKNDLGLIDHPLMLRNPSPLKAKVNGIFETSLLSVQY